MLTLYYSSLVFVLRLLNNTTKHFIELLCVSVGDSSRTVTVNNKQ